MLSEYLKLNKERSEPLSTLIHEGPQVLWGPAGERGAVPGHHAAGQQALPDPRGCDNHLEKARS